MSRTLVKSNNLYLEAVRTVVVPSSMAAFNARLQDNNRGFGVNRSKFLSIVESYSNMASSIAREVLRAIFFAPRGSPASVISKNIAPKINAMHDVQTGRWQGSH